MDGFEHSVLTRMINATLDTGFEHHDDDVVQMHAGRIRIGNASKSRVQQLKDSQQPNSQNQTQKDSAIVGKGSRGMNR